MYIEEDKPAKEIAEYFKVCPTKIKNLIHRMGIKKGKNKSCFKKGQKAWNKGLKGVNGFSSTRFDGSNKYPDGTVVTCKWDGTLKKLIYIKGKRIPYHRYVYLKANPDFKGVVKFKDGNYLNCELSNLYGISSAENMLKNSVPSGTARRKSIQIRAGMNRRLRRKYELKG